MKKRLYAYAAVSNCYDMEILELTNRAHDVAEGKTQQKKFDNMRLSEAEEEAKYERVIERYKAILIYPNDKDFEIDKDEPFIDKDGTEYCLHNFKRYERDGYKLYIPVYPEETIFDYKEAYYRRIGRKISQY